MACMWAVYNQVHAHSCLELSRSIEPGPHKLSVCARWGPLVRSRVIRTLTWVIESLNRVIMQVMSVSLDRGPHLPPPLTRFSALSAPPLPAARQHHRAGGLHLCHQGSAAQWYALLHVAC